MIRLVVAEDHLMVRAGICALIEKAGDIKVVAEAANGREALEAVIKFKPDVVLMDIMMPIINGIHTTENIRELKLSTRVLLLSMYSDEDLVHRALKSGAKGYVLKSSVSEELIQAIRSVARGEVYLSGLISTILTQSTFHSHSNKAPLDLLDTLSPREKEILQLIAEEHTSNEIAEILFISAKTVEKHRANLMEKLNTRNLAGLVRLAVKYKLVDHNG